MQQAYSFKFGAHPFKAYSTFFGLSRRRLVTMQDDVV